MELFARGKLYLGITALVLLGSLAALWAKSEGVNIRHVGGKLPQRSPVYTLSLKANRTTIPTNEGEEVAIILNAPNLSQLNGIAVRLVTNLTDEAITALQPGPKLKQAGFTFPIKKIQIEPQTDRVILEFAALSFPKKEQDLAAPLTLATFQLRGVNPQKVKLRFDPAVTKITFWDQRRVNLKLVGEKFEIQ